MQTIADLIATAAPETMSRKHDADPDDRDRHLDVALDRVYRGLTVDECRARHGIGRMTVYRYVDWALSYDCEQSVFLRAYALKKQRERARSA